MPIYTGRETREVADLDAADGEVAAPIDRPCLEYP